MVLGKKVREVRLWFKDLDVLEVMTACSLRGSLYPLLNDILNTMRGSGWTLKIVDDGTCIFSRSRDSSCSKEFSATQELIMDDKEDMTQSQLATCQLETTMTL